MIGTFGWAMVQVRDGHKICRKSWGCKTCYYWLDDTGRKLINEDGDEIFISDHFRDSLVAEDWMIWEQTLTFNDLAVGDKFQWDFDHLNNFSRWTYQKLKDNKLLTVDTSVEDCMYELLTLLPGWENKVVYKVIGKVVKDD